MLARVTYALLASLVLAGCAGDDGAPAAPPSSVATTPGVPAPTSPSAPATPSTPVDTPGDGPVTPSPEPGSDDEASAEGYVAPVFDAQEKVAVAADPAAFADVNPIDYRNPWR